MRLSRNPEVEIVQAKQVLAGRAEELATSVFIAQMAGTVENIRVTTLGGALGSGEEIFYRVQVAPNGVPAMTTTGRELAVQPDMTAQVDIRTGDRTLVDFLLEPLRKTLSEASADPVVCVSIRVARVHVS